MLVLPDPDLVLWDRFQGGALSERERAEHAVVARWARSRELGANPVGLPTSGAVLDGLALRERRERVAPLLSRAEGLLASAVTEINRRGFALLLADEDGVVLASRGAELFADPGIRAGLSEGARWHEAARGTNAIGTALAEHTAVTVLGRAHYAQGAHGLACYAAPVHDPSDRLVAVLDLTGPVGAADPLLGVVVQSLAATIESVLHAQAYQRAAAGSRSRVIVRARPADVEISSAFSGLVGDDPVLAEARRRAAAFARSSLPVLLLAETGAGKELMARAIHAASDRARGPFVVVNCGALSESLLESEIFGFAPGAFTGANPRGSGGKIGAAEGGTLFLDEIGEMSPALQVLLLRVLEDGTYSRIGEAKERRADFRLVCATWRDLARLVSEGRFRQDLFFRILGVQIALPPLRERRDLPQLAQALLENLSEEAGLPAAPSLSNAALAELAARRWPGNVRELRTALQYALVLAGGAPVLEPRHLPPDSNRAAEKGGERRSAESEALRRALDRCGGNLSQAARELGVARSTLYRMMARHRLVARQV